MAKSVGDLCLYTHPEGIVWPFTPAGAPSLTRFPLAESRRLIGHVGVPEFFGKPSQYTEGTAFLGTPPDHQERLKRRPISPDVFEMGKPGFHYKMPWGAVTSITNRVTGAAMHYGFAAAGAAALVTDLPEAIDAFKQAFPLLVWPLKFAISFNLIYHYLGGVRHIVWDHHRMGNQVRLQLVLASERSRASRNILRLSSLPDGQDEPDREGQGGGPQQEDDGRSRWPFPRRLDALDSVHA